MKQYSLNDYLEWVLSEDIGNGDITTDNLIPIESMSKARIVVKEEGVVSGLQVAEKLISVFSGQLKFMPKVKNGTYVKPGTLIAELEGKTRHILQIERTLLNFLKKLSGIATYTHKFVNAAKGHPVKILDTRKTTPGMRKMEKQAVVDGGGYNHRIGLYDMVLIKENHLAAHKGEALKEVITNLKKEIPEGTKIELEVHSFAILEEALNTDVDIIMLDNFNLKDAATAVKVVKGAGKRILTEISGNVTLDNVAVYAATGADRIAIGAITHSAPALDFSLLIT
ncbi:MAG: carboxylating nicotinate-nucleotide diphosphorylase [Candidatus Margulisiibacteriota bacterium]